LPVAEEIPKAGEQDVRIIVQEPGMMRVLRTRRARKERGVSYSRSGSLLSAL
jgi:hypothetical protein